jgi:hypothetical protein
VFLFRRAAIECCPSTVEALMRRIVLGSLLAFLLVLPSFTAAQQVQQARVVRVGVIAEADPGRPVANWTFHARWQRDLLVNYLNQRSPGKNSHLRLEAVPLTSLSSRDIDSEARDKGCEYVVVVWYESPGGYSLGEKLIDDAWLGGSVSGEWVRDSQDLYDAVVKAVRR